MKKKMRTSKYKMRACILTLTKAFLFSSFFCCVGAMYSAQAEDLPEAKGPFFYRADKGGKSLYLLGTFHIDDLDQLQCHSHIMSFLEDSDFLFTEFSQEMSVLAINELVADTSKSSDYEFEKLSENSKKFLVDILKYFNEELYGIENLYSDEQYIEELKQLSSVGTAITIGGSCLLSGGNIDINLMSTKMDVEIQQIADNLNIPQNFLDDIKEIRDVMDFYVSFLSYPLIAKDIHLIIDDYDQFCKIMMDRFQPLYQNIFVMRNLYRTGEIGGSDIEYFLKFAYQRGKFLFSYFDNSVPEDKGFKVLKDVLLKNRNQKWIKKIRQSHENNDFVFIAAGLAHLIGSDNILDMLREDDFSIQRMNTECSFNSAL